ncbi:MAG: DUF1847 domain-containing protein [Gemmatimonadota bacterium]
MAVECARCDRYACRVGRLDATPENCPMRGSFPEFDVLYASERARLLAHHAARVEADGYGRWVRVREVVELSRRMGYSRLGVAHCPDTRVEAELTAGYLEEAGFRVVLPRESGRCAPVAQADLFRAELVDLSVVAGMCVGHDALFIRRASGPVTSLVVRDVRLHHNPVAALHGRKGYLKDALYGRRPRRGDRRFSGWSDDLLDRLAAEVRDAGAGQDPPPCRVEEVMEFAGRAGVERLGLVFCIGFREEAHQLASVLGTNGFRVSSSCCKTGSVPKERVGIRNGQKVRPGRREMLCNPLAQAELLEREGVGLVLLMGQCVGHDSLTISRLRTPAVFVVAKDRVLAHNTAAALYGWRAG